MRCSLVFFFVLACSATADVKQRLDIYTEEFPPYQTLISPGKVGGVATAMVKEILEEAQLPYQIHLLPWFRSTTNVAKYENSLIYSLARTQEREPSFHWIAPLCSIDVAFYRLTDRDDIVIKTLEDAKKYVVAVAAGQPSESYLLAKGFTLDKNLVVLASHEQGAGMLEKGRIDLLFGAEQFFEGVVTMLQLEGHWQSILKVDELSRRTYLAANINSDPTLIAKLESAYERLSANLNQQERCRRALPPSLLYSRTE
ncbi:substrate-binding periplasmic protein [Pseudoalteromonas xiamenensis]|uniref:Transporter substrate-binding domain-containing protein n=1 Tax=Pseudoalteromonas xiamenensis TaxID=882626 RepID=A0A975DGI3_9GAMM|nr:transporter substrate-binding domain-containing protein [Pseudoalteromonas xiamenensis]QTH71149.1 transporter substrate-binding domain-containing protein [Pseudoalteromonas xiamenensis]